MNSALVEVSPRGGILLGPKVVCDGFVESAPVRVQTHVHDDHMTGFESSKGFQTILMSEPTRELLIVELDAELPIRSNLLGIPMGESVEEESVKIELIPSEHMLGAVQVVVTLEEGTRVAYSGDFNWPLEHVPQADVLVVDSTYGSPDSARLYSRMDVESRFVELAIQALAKGPVHIKAHRGTLQRACQLLDGVVTAPVVVSPDLCRELDVYRRFGYSIGSVFPLDSDEGKLALAEGRYLRFYGRGDGSIFGVTSGTAITLSARMASPTDPVLEYSPSAYRVALSGHADFEGTLAYVKATGATSVITDNSRGGYAVELAAEIRNRLGIDAQPSHQQPTRYWGR